MNQEPNSQEDPGPEIPLTVICDSTPQPTTNQLPVPKKEREQWGNKVEFLLATIGLSVGLGNLWRFPYLCQKNGGGAFLIPFFIFIVIEGIPLFFIELGVGQRFRKTAVEVWRGMHKSLTGIGVSCMIVSNLLCIYYIIVIAWCVYYTFLSLTKELPWQQKFCDGYDTYMVHKRMEANATAMFNANPNSTVLNQTMIEMKEKLLNHTTCCLMDPPQYQWYEKTLKPSTGFEDAGIGININLLISMALSWLVVYICIVKGIKSSGKAVYFTATFPYVVLIILFFRGITLPGAMDGLEVLFKPDWNALKNPEIWRDAAAQVFFSLSLGFGALIAFASYNPINNNIVRDAYIVIIADCFTAVFGGIVVFSILGYRQHMKGISVTEGAGGAGLAFVTFTDAMLLMDVSPLWACLFFIMLLLLGIDSQFGVLEGAIAPLYDMGFVKMKKWMFLPFVIAVMFLVDLSMISGVGYYVFQIFDSYAVTIPLLVIAFAQCIAIGWVYGTDSFGRKNTRDEIYVTFHRKKVLHKTLTSKIRFADDIEFMTGRRPFQFWMFCWKYLSPFGLLIILIWTLVDTISKEPVYDAYVGCTVGSPESSWVTELPYPIWARILAAVMVLGTLAPIPIFIIIEWPKFWQISFRETFCSGIANYMPDPSCWREKNGHNSMLYEPDYQPNFK